MMTLREWRTFVLVISTMLSLACTPLSAWSETASLSLVSFTTHTLDPISTCTLPRSHVVNGLIAPTCIPRSRIRLSSLAATELPARWRVATRQHSSLISALALNTKQCSEALYRVGTYYSSSCGNKTVVG